VEPARYLGVLSERADSLLGAASGSTGLPVPTCPEWTVADLVVHIGGVWGWAAEIVTCAERVDRPDPPEDRSDPALLTWARREAASLLDVLGAADPEESCWTFGLPRSKRFWFRRQALETTLHAWDAEGAAGRPSPIDPEVAADGVDEHLTVMAPRALRARPEAFTGETVHLHRTDGDGEWVVRLGPGGESVTERSHAKADLALRGSAEALWMWCTNRWPKGTEGIERFGDEEIEARWKANIIF
jgi:uncharacterized protein (TIGR03083 family)